MECSVPSENTRRKFVSSLGKGCRKHVPSAGPQSMLQPEQCTQGLCIAIYPGRAQGKWTQGQDKVFVLGCILWFS